MYYLLALVPMFFAMFEMAYTSTYNSLSLYTNNLLYLTRTLSGIGIWSIYFLIINMIYFKKGKVRIVTSFVIPLFVFYRIIRFYYRYKMPFPKWSSFYDPRADFFWIKYSFLIGVGIYLLGYIIWGVVIIIKKQKRNRE